MKTKEQVYDEQINPLMAQIIAICQERKIAMVASFHIPNEEDDALCCSTFLTTDEYEPPSEFKRAVNILTAVPVVSPFMLRTKHADGSETMTAIVP